jgi:RNA polymerase sigma-70 factor, ECF subfamily
MYISLYSPLREFAYALTRDDGAAHDIVQDVLFVFWRDRGRIQPGDRFVPYLYKAVRNQSAKHWRHARVVRQLAQTGDGLLSRPEGVPGMGETPSETLESAETRELHAALTAAVEQLPDRQRSIVTLHLTGELNAAEIGEVIGISAEAVLMGLSRARRTLRSVLEKFRR